MSGIRMPELKIGNLRAKLPILQGGMGIGYSVSGLASAVAIQGGIGVIATAGIGRLEPDSDRNIRAANLRSLRKEIRKARELCQSAGEKCRGLIGVNLMMALSDFDDLCRAAMDEAADLLIFSAGLPLKLPKGITGEELAASNTKVAPKISSGRATGLIFKHWAKKLGFVPDAVLLEGPAAGGHLGFHKEDLDKPEFALDKLLPGVLEAVRPYEQQFGREIPVIAGGGVYTGADIHRLLESGAQGVIMGTRFVGTHECDAHDSVKQTYLDCREEDIGIIDSPVGLPGRAIINKYLKDVAEGIKKPYKCLWRCLKTCDFRETPYCIADALTNAREGLLDDGFVFAGSNAFRVNKLVSVKELVAELMRDYAKAAARKSDKVSAEAPGVARMSDKNPPEASADGFTAQNRT